MTQRLTDNCNKSRSSTLSEETNGNNDNNQSFFSIVKIIYLHLCHETPYQVQATSRLKETKVISKK